MGLKFMRDDPFEEGPSVFVRVPNGALRVERVFQGEGDDVGFGDHLAHVNSVIFVEGWANAECTAVEVDQDRDPSIWVGLGWEEDPGPEVAAIRRDVDGDVFRLEIIVICGWDQGVGEGVVPYDGAVSVVNDVGVDSDGVLLEWRRRREKRQNGK